ncbi:MAG: hypothetical protein WD490_01095 [Opitutales bacterium]
MSLIAYDTLFFGGPRKNRDGPSYTKLLVDGKAGEASDTGSVGRLEEHARGGHVVIDGGEQYANLGVENYRRHLFIEFGPAEKNNAVMAVFDRVDSRDEHTYTWNVNLGTETGLANWQIESETGSEQGYPTFTLRGAEEGVVKGWVLSPAGAELHVDEERLYVETKTASADFLIALSVEPDEPAPFEVLEEGLRGMVFRIGEATLGYDRKKGDLVNGEKALNLGVV